jgi:hypothetical protein
MSESDRRIMVDTTAATRSYEASASDAEKSSAKGAQKWGLFETNYQRKKGITTDESMAEIEQFARTGIRPEATPGTVPWTPKTGSDSSASSSSSASKFMSGASSSTPGSSAPGSSSSETTTSLKGTAFFPTGADEGTKLFEEYEKNKKKIDPKPYAGKKWSTPGTSTAVGKK